MSNKVRVLYLGGEGRSGGTLLGAMLNQVPGFCYVGELRVIWNQILNDRPCGCGSAIRDCPFWIAVFDEAFGGVDNIDVNEMASIWRAVDRKQYWAHIFLQKRSREFGSRLKRFASLLTPLYKAIMKVSGADVVVDSSRHPSYGFILNALPEIDLHVLHLVRDSRAVAFAWTKHEIKFNPYYTAFKWFVFNLFFHVLGRSNPNYMFMRYEDFVLAPKQMLDQIVSHFVKNGAYNFSFIEDHMVRLGSSHSVGGNRRVRFRKDVVEVRLDDEWHRGLSPLKKLAVTAVTFPLLRRYGYLTPDIFEIIK